MVRVRRVGAGGRVKVRRCADPVYSLLVEQLLGPAGLPWGVLDDPGRLHLAHRSQSALDFVLFHNVGEVGIYAGDGMRQVEWTDAVKQRG